MTADVKTEIELISFNQTFRSLTLARSGSPRICAGATASDDNSLVDEVRRRLIGFELHAHVGRCIAVANPLDPFGLRINL